MGLAFQKADIVFINLGEVGKGVKGHEQAKKRPCIVIKSLPNLELAIVIPLTTSQRLRSEPFVVHLPKGAGGLSKDSFALCHQIRVISYQRIINKIGQLSAHEFGKVEWALGALLDL